MTKTSQPQGTVTKNRQANNFNPADALERLHSHLVRIEAIALVACEAADELRCPSGLRAKRELIRMQIFVGQTAHEAVAAMTDADRLMSDLKGHLRAQTERESAAKPAPSRSAG